MITLVVVVGNAAFDDDGSINCTLLTDMYGVRRFVANEYDSRLGDRLPLFLNKKRWFEFVFANPGASSQLEWRVATKLFDESHFSDHFDVEKVLKRDPHALSKLRDLPKTQKSRYLKQALETV